MALLRSKKFRMALVALIVSVVLHFIPAMPEQAITEVLALAIAFIFGQGLADFGKASALQVSPGGLLQSKKFGAAVVGMIVCIATHFFPTLPPEAAVQVVSVFVAYILGQGLADFGKVAGLLNFLGGKKRGK